MRSPIMIVHCSVTGERALEACMRREMTLDNPGFCIACGRENDSCEPDAREYQCIECGKFTVYAPEELILMGAV